MLEWRPVPGYEGLEASNEGHIRNNGIICDERLNQRGYHTVYFNYKTLLVHRLVGFAFVDGYFPGATINHKDENKDNNTPSNLEWCDRAYNNRYSKNRPLEAYDDQGNLVMVFSSFQEAAKATGCRHQNISECIRGKSRRKHAGGYIWRYADKSIRGI